jgi:hypothetical protein
MAARTHLALDMPAASASRASRAAYASVISIRID